MKSSFPKIQQWKKLYDISISLKEIIPWRFFKHGDIITILKKGNEIPYFCTLFEREDELFSIAIYKGKEGMRFLKNLLDRDAPYYAAIHYHFCYFCHFVDEDELSDKDIDLITKLDLKEKMEEDDTYITFTSQSPPYAPREINCDECSELIFVTENILFVIKDMIEKKIYMDEYKNHSITRMYSKKKNKYITLPLENIVYEYEDDVKEEDFIDVKIEDKIRKNVQIELEIAYLPIENIDENSKEIYYTSIILMFNHKTWEKVDVITLEENKYLNDNIKKSIINILKEYINKEGIPKRILYRDDRIKRVLFKFAKKLRIDFVKKDNLFAVDSYMEKLITIEEFNK